MSNKSYSIESLENRIFEITIAHLSNIDKDIIDNDLIELNDVEVSLELFKNVFFNNNSRFFELNHQFRNSDVLKLQNKTIKFANFKNHKKNDKIDLQDVMIYKYLKNKKTKMNDGSKLILMKELSNYTSLADFHIYHNHLSYENILAVFNNHRHHKKNKKYFRFKIKANYYSNHLDENLVLYFNFLVKIPKNEENDKEDNSSVISKEDIISVVSEEDNFDDNDSIIDEPDVEKMEYKSIDTPILSGNLHENIIYSNYVKKLNTRITHPTLITSDIENNNDAQYNLSDDDDTLSDSNITLSSLGDNDNETNDTFF
jgi:hypothetical protein